MPAQKRIPAELLSDEILLAAIDRAERHRRKPDQLGVLLSNIKAHLGLPHNSWTTRRLRPQLTALEGRRLADQHSCRGSVVWALTSRGRQRLEAARQAGKLEGLPESPQHRDWREARAAAGERIEEFRENLCGALDDAVRLLNAAEPIPSATWFGLSERLQRATWLLASATYCLQEWAEPDDARADIDEPTYGQSGRRQVRAWGRSEPGSQIDSSSK